MSTAVYHPGQDVPRSGIYDVIHDANHRTHHQVTCVAGNRFPPCRNCGDKVGYRLFEAALHLVEDETFDHTGKSTASVVKRTTFQTLQRRVDGANKGLFAPGNKVPKSGIYEVLHDSHHPEPHEVTCVKDDRFPPCRDCGQGVQFKLQTAAEHLSEDRGLDFK